MKHGAPAIKLLSTLLFNCIPVQITGGIARIERVHSNGNDQMQMGEKEEAQQNGNKFHAHVHQHRHVAATAALADADAVTNAHFVGAVSLCSKNYHYQVAYTHM